MDGLLIALCAGSQILGEAAALPAASLLDESLRIMQTEEGKARAYDVEDYHMEWIQHALETDAVFLEGHTAATQVKVCSFKKKN